MVALSKQPAECLYAGGKRVNWRNPPKANAKCLWSKRSMYGKKVYGSFRTICFLNRLNNLAIDKYGRGIEVIQPPYNTTVAASAGTHDEDACADIYIPGVGWWEQQRFFRANGFGCWYRHRPLFGNHIHGFVLPPMSGKVRSDDFRDGHFEVGKYVDGGISTSGRKYTSSQVDDYWNHAFGLSGQHGRNSDKSWFPKNIGATIFNLNAYVAKRAAAQKAGHKIAS